MISLTKTNPSQVARIVSLIVKKCLLLKKRFFQLLLIFVLLFCTYSLSATIYYVSSTSGNDSNKGTSISEPWGTIEKVNSFKPSPGDQILFKRGDEWNGTIIVNASGTSGSPIVYGAYGSGNKPKIYSSEVITNWTLHSGGIWKASVPNSINHVYVDDKRIQNARSPKQGYFYLDGVASQYAFNCDNLNNSVDYTNAKIHIRTVAWRLLTASVTSSTNKKLTISTNVYGTISEGNAFFLNNKLDFLTAPGEWYCNNETNTLYLWTPNGDSPANHEVRVSTVNNCVYIDNKDNITIQDLELKQSKSTALYARSSDDLTVSGVNVNHTGLYGIYVGSGRRSTITSNEVSRTTSDGIYINNDGISFENEWAVISYNNVHDIAMFHDISIDGIATCNGLFIRTKNPIVRYNKLENIGYCGIHLYRGINGLVEFNYIKKYGMTLTDVGGIYAWTGVTNNAPRSNNSKGLRILSNIVDSSCPFGTNFHEFQKPYVDVGIYADDGSEEIYVEGNTIVNSYSGIYFHNTINCKAYNNTLVDCSYSILDGQNSKYSFQTGNIYKNNIICNTNNKNYYNVGTGSVTSPRLIRSPLNHSSESKFNENTYIDRHRTTTFNNMSSGTDYYFTGWKTACGEDANSTFISTKLAEGETEKLFYNNTKQSKTINLGSSVYKDVYGKQVPVTLVLEPFTSKILIRTSEKVQSNQSPIIQGQIFNIQNSIQKDELVGQVVASDPDPGQTLSYSFQQLKNGNLLSEGELFSINSLTGEISANTSNLESKDTTIILCVQVSDNAVTPLTACANISINVINLSPTFSAFLFEEPSGSTILDSKNSNKGTILNEELRGEGVSGKGLEFTGSGYINLGQSFGENVKNEITLSAWIKPQASGTWQGIIMHGGPNVDSYALYINPSSKSIGFKTSGTTSDFISAENITDLWNGAWHQITVSYNGKEKIIYLDGVAILTIDASGTIDSGQGYNLYIGAGRDEDPVSLLYSGLIDEVRIYNYSLTGDEITELYTSVKPILQPVYSSEDISICEGNSYESWTTTGQYQRVLTAASGADSIITTNLVVNLVYQVFEDINILEGENYQSWTQAGQYERTLTSLTGCDSIVITNLTIVFNKYTTEDISICEGNSYEGLVTTGQYQRVFTSTSGADSIITTNLAVNPVYQVFEDVNILEGENYQSWSQAGQYERALTSITGCDSTVITNLMVALNKYTTEDISICEGRYYEGLATTGQYQRVLTAASGADSIVTTNLVVNSVYQVSEDINILEGENYHGWSQAGQYERTLTSFTGCDSIVITNLTVATVTNTESTRSKDSTAVYSSEDISICEGRYYEGLATTGQYQRVLTASSGADSIVTTNLFVNPIYNIIEEVAIWEGESYRGWSQTGQYERTLSSFTGCDSIVITNLIVTSVSNTDSKGPIDSSPVYGSENISICEGSSYASWTTTGQYQRVLTAVSGADSIVTTNLFVNSIYNIIEEIAILEGESYRGWFQAGQYERVLTSLVGCDSIVITNLSVEQLPTQTQTIELEKGWNIFSTYLTPISETMDSVMEVLRSKGELIKVQDEENNTYESGNLKSGNDWINNIGEVQKTEGYKIQVESACTLEITGTPVNLPLNIEIKRGENLISFPINSSIDAMQIIQPLIDSKILKKIQDEKGNSIETWRKIGWINGIGNFTPGEGYILQAKKSGVLRISDLSDKSGVFIAERLEPAYFNVCYEGNGIDHMNINISELNEADFEVGDEIAAFDGGICVGAVKLTESDFTSNALSIPVSASVQKGANGFTEGNPIELKVWKNETNKESKLFPEVIEGDMIFTKQASVFALLKSQLTNTTDILDNIKIDLYPNPARSNVTIRFSELPKEGTTFTLMDAMGKSVRTRNVQTTNEKLYIEDLPSGMYFVRTKLNGKIKNQKLIKN